jgi:uncharacterized protein (TIGR02453 family)
MLNPSFLEFLYELSQNNNRGWFEKNKTRFQKEVQQPFEVLVSEIIKEIKAFDPNFSMDPKQAAFRIYRDVRFSNDKTPYKTHMAAVFTNGGRQNMHDPGYYLHIEYGFLQLGGGAYFLDKEPLQKVRTRIMQNPSAFRQLIEASEFVDKFEEIKGEKNKILSTPFKEAVAVEPLLLNKQFYYMAELDPKMILESDFPKFVASYFQAALPVNRFLLEAVK